MRSIWSGAISFGLVNIPVKLYPATGSRRVTFHLLHNLCGSRIRYRKWCPVCDREVGPEDLVRGYEYARGQYVIVREEELERLPVPTKRTIEILDFVQSEEIDPVYYDTAYYLEPDRGGEKAYRLLMAAMAERRRIAVAKVTLCTRETLAALRGYQGRALVLSTMYYPDEIRPVAEIPGLARQPDLQERELELAVHIIDNLSGPFEPTRYTDEYREALQELIARKIEGREVSYAPEEPRAPVIDLMEALKRSLEATERRPRRQVQG